MAGDASSLNFLDFDFVNGQTVATRVQGSFPLRLMLPKHCTDVAQEANWCYLLNFGGGLLQGDCIDLQVRVADNCYAVLASQGSTKVFKNTRDPGGTLTANGGARSSQAVDVGAASWNSSSAEAKTTATNGMSEARQLMACSVGQGALCAVLPQPVTAFRDARYLQRQRFDLPADGSGSLLLVDWTTAGRMERGEAWQFQRFATSNEVWFGDRMAFLDAVLLEDPFDVADNVRTLPSVAERMGKVNAFGMVLLVGPALRAAREHIRARVMQRGTFHNQSGRGTKRAHSDTSNDNEDNEAEAPSFPLLCSASDVWIMGGDEHSLAGVADDAEEGAPALVLRFATETTEEAHDALLAALAPLKETLGRIPYGPVAV